MANPVSGAANAQQVAETSQTQANLNAQRAAASKPAAPQDTVTISQAGNTASQAHAALATQKSGSDGDHGGS
jgi:hypothetical protein